MKKLKHSLQLYIQYQNFFGELLNQRLYELAISKNDVFTRSKTAGSKDYPDWRKSTIIYDNQFVFFKKLIEEQITEKLSAIKAGLQIPPFETETYEVQLTSHNDGEYFKWHMDNSSAATANRTITFVYYFHAVPKPFTGGELVIYHNGESHMIQPINDSIVFFHSGRKHEVKTVSCPGKKFAHGRFTLNGWIRAKSVSMQYNDCFGYNILKPAVFRRT